MNIVTAILITYPKAPKGWKGMGYYYEKKELGTFEMPDSAFMEDCVEEVKVRYLAANQFNVADESHPAGWCCGSVS